MPPSVSYTESHSYEGSPRRQWLPPAVLVAFCSLGVASIVGVSMSAVVFSNAEDLKKPGNAVAQSFVMFASILSLSYLLVHVFAARKGDGLYFDPPIPAFRHQLHASAITIARIAAAMWASAVIAVAIALYRGHSGGETIRLIVDMFSSATGFLSECAILSVVHLANRPFDTTWISPMSFDDYASTGGVLDVRTSSLTIGSGNTGVSGRLGGKQISNVTSTMSPGNISRSTSSSQSRAKKMAQTRRYIIDAPGSVVLTPVMPQKPKATANKQTGNARDVANPEDDILVEPLESVSSAAAGAKDGIDKSRVSIVERPISPDTVIYVGPSIPQRTARSGDGKRISRPARRRPVNSPAGPRALKKTVGQPVSLERTPETVQEAQPAPLETPAPPPTPPQAYAVPGAWLPQPSPEQKLVGCA